MKSSHTEQEPSPSLADVVAALEKRGRKEDATNYQARILTQLWFLHGITEETAMIMPIEEIVALLQVPPIPVKYAGWDTFYWGEAVLGGDDSKRDT